MKIVRIRRGQSIGRIEVDVMRSLIAAALLVICGMSIITTSCTQRSLGPRECEFEYIPHDTPPRVKHRVQPYYPWEAKRAGLQGSVLLHLFIDKHGTVTMACVAISLHPLLDKEALKAARLTRFYPALRKGVPIGVWVAYPVRFPPAH